MVECKEDADASRALLVLEHNIKKYGSPPFSVIAVVAPCSQPYADGRVECKEDVDASRALLVLEHNIEKGRPSPAIW